MNSRIDRLTLIAIAIVAYALANIVHEGIGHGGMAYLLSAQPQVLSSVHFEYNQDSASLLTQRWISLAGSLANVIFGCLALLWLKRARDDAARLFFWLLASVNFLQAAGYLMFSGIGNIGDWARVIRDWQPAILWRIGMAVIGTAAYVFIAKRAAFGLANLLGKDDALSKTARQLAMTVYFTGGVLYCVSALLNPHGFKLVLISAAAASFGGTSALLWCMSWLHKVSPQSLSKPALQLPRQPRWIAAAAVMVLLFIPVLGAGIALPH